MLQGDRGMCSAFVPRKAGGGGQTLKSIPTLWDNWGQQWEGMQLDARRIRSRQQKGPDQEAGKEEGGRGGVGGGAVCALAEAL